MKVQNIDRKQVSPYSLTSLHHSDASLAGLLAPLAALAVDLGHILDWALYYHQWLRRLLEV
jgi:hypothetical protein